jgi:hypothetical protein
VKSPFSHSYEESLILLEVVYGQKVWPLLSVHIGKHCCEFSLDSSQVRQEDILLKTYFLSKMSAKHSF